MSVKSFCPQNRVPPPEKVSILRIFYWFVQFFLISFSGGRGCLGEECLGVPGQVWELMFLSSFPSFPRGIAVREMSGKTPASPRHPSSRYPRPSSFWALFGGETKFCGQNNLWTPRLFWKCKRRSEGWLLSFPPYSISRDTCSNSIAKLSCLFFIKGRKRKKKKTINFLWPQMARLGPPFWPPKSPRTSSCGCLFCVLFQEMRHINFFFWGPKTGCFRWGPKRLCAFSVPYLWGIGQLLGVQKLTRSGLKGGSERDFWTINLPFWGL